MLLNSFYFLWYVVGLNFHSSNSKAFLSEDLKKRHIYTPAFTIVPFPRHTEAHSCISYWSLSPMHFLYYIQQSLQFTRITHLLRTYFVYDFLTSRHHSQKNREHTLSLRFCMFPDTRPSEDGHAVFSFSFGFFPLSPNISFNVTFARFHTYTAGDNGC